MIFMRAKQDEAQMLFSFTPYLPAAIFTDRQGKVRKIHTGFSGPGTGKYYEEWVADFNKTMDELLAEK